MFISYIYNVTYYDVVAVLVGKKLLFNFVQFLYFDSNEKNNHYNNFINHLHI